MGNTIERKIMFVGLSGAGSTQLLYSLKLLRSPDVSFKPSNGTWVVISTRLQCAFDEFSSSAGFNYEAIDCLDNDTTTKRYKLHIFDLPGNEDLRCVWENFYNNMNVDVLAYIVDASDHSISKLEKVRNVFSMLCNEETLKGAAKLIVLNQKKTAGKWRHISKAEI